MNVKAIFAAFAVATALSMTSCEDELSQIGSDLASGDVTIRVDSIVTDIEAENVYYDSFDGRNMTKLIGRINVPQYGSLSCSFVTQFMSATKMNIPDSIKSTDLDSVRLVFSVPRGSLTGDSLAPQQLKVYRLEKQLPSDIQSAFNPTNYYNPSSAWGEKSYTLSVISKGDSAVKNDVNVRIPVKLPLAFGEELFEKYRNNDPVFEWPSTFNEYFPGIYVEQNFGNGCIANVSRADLYLYWHRYSQEYVKVDSTYQYKSVLGRDSVCLLSSMPEVVSSNVINYEVSDYIKSLADAGEHVITTPGGYRLNIKFPVAKLVEEFRGNGDALSVVSSLKFEIPAQAIDNDYGLGVAPYMLMIRKDEFDSFFEENKVPDGINSFYAAYNTETASYQFDSMRNYFLKVIEDDEADGDKKVEDTEFVLVPVGVTTESVTDYYGNVSTYVTRCQPYITKPTMTRLFTDRSIICFTYSSQKIN